MGLRRLRDAEAIYQQEFEKAYRLISDAKAFWCEPSTSPTRS